MPAVRDHTQTATAEVAFEVERAGWPSPDRLEVVGRWFGVRGRRFIRPTLYVEADGEPRRLLAVLDHKPWAVEDGEEWIAAFAWEGDPVDLAGSELTVSPGIAVELRPSAEREPAKRRFARPPRADVLGSELAGEREKRQKLSRDLHEARAEHSADMVRTAREHEEELERVRSEKARAEQEAERRLAELRSELDAARDRSARLETALRKVRDELAVARADVAAQRAGLEHERATFAAEASDAAAEEVEKLRVDLDAARAEAAEARAERDGARRESATARGERDAAIRDRDRARQERQVLISRVRSEGEKRRGVQPSPSAARDTTPTLPAPPIIQSEISAVDRSSGPGVAVAVALVVLAVVVVLLVVAFAL
jgi:hypothetical protein